MENEHWEIVMGKWIEENLLRKKSFWEVKSKTQTGSWMWRKLLKLRDIAKTFYMKEIGNGHHTSFWYDKWSDRGVLIDILGGRGIIDMSIGRAATIKEASLSRRRKRRHRTELLNDIEAELNEVGNRLCIEKEDVSLWRRESGYKQEFSTHETWSSLRVTKTPCYLLWIESQDGAKVWTQHVSSIWESLVKGILKETYTNEWNATVNLISDEKMERKRLFCIRYAFQIALYTLWRERNKVRHEEKILPIEVLKKLVDKRGFEVVNKRYMTKVLMMKIHNQEVDSGQN
ncbi:uncharacterized protein LOC106378230 [Brassica napus]|uniref:uncharacterized protein LOC106378230 n=1 Tax=Brassica napus TaxID=3708 RepID=UPI00207897D2|nr:uncharacterized protein LOC106378230 [Brassica napus]